MQYARPNSDISIGNWTGSGSGTSNIYQRIDEVSYSDSDYIKSENNPTSTCEIGLSTITDPENNINHVLNFRILGAGLSSANGDVTIYLFDGATEIASWAYTNIGSGASGTITAKTESLSTVQADNITDYSNLRMKASATKTSGIAWGGGVTWFEFTTDDAPLPSGWSNKILDIDSSSISKVNDLVISNISKILSQ